ncbi:MAG: S-methyl-5'-thioadenosine phosphorylase [Candidatus Diapherotrites archaeon]
MIGIIGGYGILDEKALKGAKKKSVKTKWGKPSGRITVGKLHGVEVAFLPRHGEKHIHNPTNVPYRANIAALKKLGCGHIISVNAVGSLRDEIMPGEVVFVDQMIDFTHKRHRTFYDEKKVAHIGVAEPSCNALRKVLINAARELGISHKEMGTYVCIEGPRFSTRAESRMFRAWGGDVIGMTMAPEAVLAREAEMCYANIATVTDYDTFREEESVSTELVLKTMEKNTADVRRILAHALPRIEKERKCVCSSALKGAFI